MTEEAKEHRRFRKNGKPWYSYVWETKRFSPVTHEGLWTISFKFPDGSVMKDAFKYDWRLWTIPELRSALEDAGFKETLVYWEEGDEDGDGNGVYYPTEVGENDHSWVSYVMGHKV